MIPCGQSQVRDLKAILFNAGNILLQSSEEVPHGFTVKICDFGLARLTTTTSETLYTGSYSYQAPEVLEHQQTSKVLIPNPATIKASQSRVFSKLSQILSLRYCGRYVFSKKGSSHPLNPCIDAAAFIDKKDARSYPLLTRTLIPVFFLMSDSALVTGVGYLFTRRDSL